MSVGNLCENCQQQGCISNHIIYVISSTGAQISWVSPFICGILIKGTMLSL